MSRTSGHQSSSLALSAILLAFCFYFETVQSTTAVSTVYIVPASDSPPTCPGEPCLTVDQYVSNSSLRDEITDIIMQLQPGHHNLSVPFTIDTQTDTDSGISSIAMIGIGPGDVTLLCVEEFSFNFMNSVRIGGINLVNCGGPSTHIRNVTNFTLEDSTFQSDMPFRVRLSANPVIMNSVFSNCTDGVLFIRDSRPMIRNCTFSNNMRQANRSNPSGIPIEGSAIYLFNCVNASIDQCTFENNTANRTGGVVFITNGELYVTNSYFFSNTAIQSDGGAMSSYNGSISIEDSNFTNNCGFDGGAVYIFKVGGTIVIRRCDFANNTAISNGGAVRISGQLFHMWINNSRFVGNSAFRGGAVWIQGSNIFFSTFQSSYVNNSGISFPFEGSGALFFVIGNAKIVLTQATFTKNQGYFGAIGLVKYSFSLAEGITSYSITVQNSDFVENVATNSGGAIGLISSDFGNITIQDSEFNSNSGPQCGALNFDPEPVHETQNAKILASIFANNSATVGSGGALCASGISLSISGTPFRENSAVTGGGAISTDNSDLTISGAFFFDNSARSGGDAIHACSSEVTIESSDGLLGGSVDGQCLLYDNNGASSNNVTVTFPDNINGGVSSHAINLALFLYMTLVVLMSSLY